MDSSCGITGDEGKLRIFASLFVPRPLPPPLLPLLPPLPPPSISRRNGSRLHGRVNKLSRFISFLSPSLSLSLSCLVSRNIPAREYCTVGQVTEKFNPLARPLSSMLTFLSSSCPCHARSSRYCPPTFFFIPDFRFLTPSIVNLGSIDPRLFVRFGESFRKVIFWRGSISSSPSPPRLGRKPRASGGKVKRSIFT